MDSEIGLMARAVWIWNEDKKEKENRRAERVVSDRLDLCVDSAWNSQKTREMLKEGLQAISAQLVILVDSCHAIFTQREQKQHRRVVESSHMELGRIDWR